MRFWPSRTFSLRFATSRRAGRFIELLHETLGMAIQYDHPKVFYCIGGRTGVAIRSAPPERRDTPFDRWRVGLHHVCFRLRSREDIDTLHAAMRDCGAEIVRAPEDGPWARGIIPCCSRIRMGYGSKRTSCRAQATSIASRTRR